jgi:hypothetical protein
VEEDDRGLPEDWHNNQQVAIAGGIAAVLLLGLLIYAVFRVSDDSVAPPPMPVYPATSNATTSTTLKTLTSTTDYPRNSVQTSEPALAPVGPPPGEPPPNEPPTENTWTPTNPYATTTQERAGSI